MSSGNPVRGTITDVGKFPCASLPSHLLTTTNLLCHRSFAFLTLKKWDHSLVFGDLLLHLTVFWEHSCWFFVPFLLLYGTHSMGVPCLFSGWRALSYFPSLLSLFLLPFPPFLLICCSDWLAHLRVLMRTLHIAQRSLRFAPRQGIEPSPHMYMQVKCSTAELHPDTHFWMLWIIVYKSPWINFP